MKTFISAQGVPIEVDDTNDIAMRAALAGGMREETPAEAVQRTKLEALQTPLAMAETGLGAAASGASLGLSDVALRGIAPSYADRQGLLRQANPLTAAGGELLGTVAPLLIPGLGEAAVARTGAEVAGATRALALADEAAHAPGLLASAGRVLGAPVRAAAGIAEGAGGLTQTGLGALGITGQSLRGRALVGAARAGVAGAVEGGLQGAGLGLSEAALAPGGDFQHLGERVLASAKGGALFGGLLGAAGGAVTGAFGGGILSLSPKGRAASGELAAERAIKALDIRGSDFRKLGSEAKVQQVGQDLLDYRFSDGKRLIEAGDNAEQIAAKLAQAKEEVGGQLGALRQTVLDDGSSANPLAREFLQNVKDDVLKPLRNSPSPTIQARALDVENELSSLSIRAEKVAAAENAVRNTTDKIDQFLIAPTLRSKSASIRAVGEAYSKKLTVLREALDSGALTKEEVAQFSEGLFERMSRHPSSKVRASVAELKKELRKISVPQPITFAELRDQQRALKEVLWPAPPAGQQMKGIVVAKSSDNDLLKAERLLENHMEKHVEAVIAKKAPEQAGTYKGLRRQYESFAKADSLARKAQGQNLGNRWMSPTDYLSGISMAAGSLAAGNLFAPAVGLGSALIHRTVRERGSSVIARIAHDASKSQGVMLRSVSQYLKGGVTGGRMSADRELTKNENNTRAERLAKYNKTVEDLGKVQAQAQLAVQSPHPEAPETSLAIEQTRLAGAEYLQQHKPAGSGGDPLLPKRALPDPDPVALVRFERRVQAVNNPLSVLDEMKRGTLSREHVDALKTVYPRLYAELRENITQQLIKRDEPLSSPQRQTILQLFDMVDPARVSANQAQYQQTQQNQNNGAPRARSGRSLKLPNSRTSLEIIGAV